jgi:hypothetical protein
VTSTRRVIEVVAVFRAADERTLARLRALLPSADIESDGWEVTVRVVHDEGPAGAAEGADATRTRLLERGRSAGFGPALRSSLDVWDV